MTLDLAKFIATRDGRAASILSTTVCNADFPLAVLVTEVDGTQNVWPYNSLGERDPAQQEPNPNDLVNVPTVVVYYLNFYESPPACGMYASRRAADVNGDMRNAVFAVTYTDGVITAAELAQ